MLVLGIETSCDETAASVVEDGREVLSSVVSSSLHLHRQFGGIVPEIASRYHVELIDSCIQKALTKAGCKLTDIKLIAVTNGPGLVGALLVGVGTAKALSLACNTDLVGVNHLYAHIYAALMSNKALKYPFVGLIVSGGHTNLVFARDVHKYQPLGQTVDDACGEAFDKVAKILGLGFPGGPIIEKRAQKGDPHAIKFPISFSGDDGVDFSFSGIKTAVLYYVQKIKGKPSAAQVADICASFQRTVVDDLVNKALLACRKKKVNCIAVGGGVSANTVLRESLKQRADAFGVRAYFPKMSYCLDNAAMCAGLGYWLYKKGLVSKTNLQVMPNLGIGG